MSKTVIALFDSVGQANDAVQALERTGFVSERIQVQTGEELIARARGTDDAPAGAQSGIQRFVEDLGLAPEGQRGTAAPLSAEDTVILLQASDDRAEEAAAILDRHGAVDVNERTAYRGERVVDPIATPPHLDEIGKYDDIDERSLASAGRPPQQAGARPRRRARVYAATGEPTRVEARPPR